MLLLLKERDAKFQEKKEADDDIELRKLRPKAAEDEMRLSEPRAAEEEVGLSEQAKVNHEGTQEYYTGATEMHKKIIILATSSSAIKKRRLCAPTHLCVWLGTRLWHRK